MKQHLHFKSALMAITIVITAMTSATATAADPWPSTKPVKIITAFGAGSASDIVARMIAEHLSATFHQTFIVDNRPGASGIIAAEAVARSAPDGYTLFLTTNTAHSANPYLFKKLPYEPIKDYTPIARVCYFPFVLAVDAAKPIADVAQLLAYAKDPANKASYAYGNSTGQVAGASFNALAGLKATPVPYKSTPQALTDLSGGQVTFMFVDLASGQASLKSNRIRAIAVSSARRSALVPDLPPVAEAASLPGFDLAAWVGVLAPAGLAPDTQKKLSDAIQQYLARKEVVDKLTGMGADVASGSAADLETLMKTQLEVWGRKVRDAGIEPES
ncbi:tripartite tricarboxylate transporter substrate binding protein [soil metagenome]